MAGQISLKDIQAMLDVCAPGYKWSVKTHRIHVTHGKKAFRALPTGVKASKGMIECGWVRKLARQLDIVDCANREIPALTT